MKLLGLPAFAFLCFLHGIVVDGQRHLKGSKPKDLPDDVTTTIDWPLYCRCFHLATTASTDEVRQQAKQCFLDFFQSEEQRRILRLHRGRREECLTPANDGDSECKVCLEKIYKKDASDNAQIISPGLPSSMTNFRGGSVHFI